MEEVYAGLPFPARETRPYVLVNMVASLDGKASAGGKAGAIGSLIDRALMRILRARADAVMTGARTLRAEKLTLAVPRDLARSRASRGLKPQPLAVLVTGSGEVPLDENLTGASSDNLLVLASPEIPRERLAYLSSRAAVEVLPEIRRKEPKGRHTGLRLDLEGALEVLKKRYAVDVLLVEGGPTLNHAFVVDGLADELFLTLAPKLVGGSRPENITVLEGPPLPPRAADPNLLSVYLSGDELFLRYALRPAGPG